jgi:DNA-binding GntR family transcriptional regulator
METRHVTRKRTARDVAGAAGRSAVAGTGASRRIARDSFEPAYFQLAQILRTRITEGEFHAGDQIPTEVELIRAYGLSPMTVRRAIKILVDEGAVRATRGRGTFVEAASIATATFDLRSFRALLEDPEVSVRMLAVRISPASARVAGKLQVAPGARVVQIRRLLSRGDERLLYHREWLTYDPRRPVVETELGLTALHDLFEGRGSVGPKRGRISLLASTLREEEAGYLEAGVGEPAFLLEHHFFGFDDLPFSWGLFVCRAGLLRFEATVGFEPGGAAGGASDDGAAGR